MIYLPYGSFTPNTELDNYGFSYNLSRILGVKRRAYSFAGWLHGWKYWEINKDFGIAGGNSRSRYLVDIFVPTEKIKKALYGLGYSKVHMGFAPWAAWALDPLIKIEGRPYQNSLRILGVLPKKPSEQAPHHQFNTYLEYLIDTYKGENLTVLISHATQYVSPVINVLKKGGIRWVVGPGQNEINGLSRIAYIMSRYDYVISGYIGTHLGIASLAGAKVGITGPYVEPVDKDNPWYAEYEEVVNERYVRRLHSTLFAGELKDCERHYDFFSSEAGLDIQLNKNQTLTILGWNTKGLARKALSYLNISFLCIK